MRYCIFLLLLLMMSCAAFDELAYDKEIEADRIYRMGEYFKAVPMYEECYNAYKLVKSPKEAKKEAIKSSARVAYKIARNNHKIGELKEARKWYSQAEELNYFDKKPKLYFYIAELNRSFGDIDNAILYYNKFKKLFPEDSLIANTGLASCEQVRLWSKNKRKSDFEVYEVTDLSNKKYSDYSAIASNPDGTEVFFTSNREGTNGRNINNVFGKFYSDIFSSKKVGDNTWSTPTILKSKEINSEFSDGAISFSKDYKRLFYTHCEEVSTNKNSCVIKYSDSTDLGWSLPVEVKIPKMKKATIGHPSVSVTGDTLYFSSDYQDSTSFGGKDIWYVVKIDSNELSDPINMGKLVNTSGDEVFPYIRQDGQFFFSSNGHVGMGGLDIYEIITKNGVEKLNNLKPPVNSKGDDFAISFSKIENRKYYGYFSTNRGSQNLDNIWQFVRDATYSELIVKVINASSKKDIVGAKVTVKDSNGEVTELFSDDNSMVLIPIADSTKYTLFFEKENYLNDSLVFSTLGLKNLVDTNRIVALFPINVVENIDKLSENRDEALDSLLAIMLKNKDLKLLINAHEDYPESEEINFEKTRIKASDIVNKLINGGIDKKRLLGIGYGEEVPLVVDSALQDEYKDFLSDNMGDELDSLLIITFNKKQQKIANDLNKREAYMFINDDDKFDDYKFEKERYDKKFNIFAEKRDKDKLLNKSKLASNKTKDELEKLRTDKEDQISENLLAEKNKKLAGKNGEWDKDATDKFGNNKFASKNRANSTNKDGADSESRSRLNKRLQRERDKLDGSDDDGFGSESGSDDWWDNDGDKDQKRDKYLLFKRRIESLFKNRPKNANSNDVLIQVGAFNSYVLSAKLRDKIRSYGLITSQEKFRFRGRNWYRVYVIHKNGVDNLQKTYNSLISIGVTETPMLRLINW